MGETMEAARIKGNQSDWVVQIQSAIEREIEVLGGSKGFGKCTIFRFPRFIKGRLADKGTSYYAPEHISLGLFHRPGRNYKAPERGERFKVKMASALVATMKGVCPTRVGAVEIAADDSPGLKGNMGKGPTEDVAESAKRAADDKPCSRATSREPSAQTKSTFGGTSRPNNNACKDFDWKSILSESDFDSIVSLYNFRDDDDRMPSDESRRGTLCALTLDAIAVVAGLGVLYLERNDPKSPFLLFHNRLERHGQDGKTAVQKLSMDFIKLENQVPLHLLRRVMHVLYNEVPGNDINDESPAVTALNSICARLAIDFCGRCLPGYDNDILIRHMEKERGFLSADHLLDCISLVMRRERESKLPGDTQNRSKRGKSLAKVFLGWIQKWVRSLYCSSPTHIANHSKSPSRMLSSKQRGSSRSLSGGERSGSKHFNIPCATLLYKSGIDFKHRICQGECDLLPVFEAGWLTAKLYIPKMPRLSEETIVIWKNLLAYESRALDGELKSESQLLALTGFMDNLIDTEEDVLLLTRDGNSVIPDRYATPPEDLARMFNSILSGSPIRAYPRWTSLKHKINDYHEQRCRRMVLDFLRTNCGNPWLVTSVVAASLLLVLTVLQTIYALLSFYG